MTSLMHTYNRLPVAFTKGDGAYLEDSEGKRYIDALTGLAVCGLGHAHPAVTAAISSQAETLLHTSNLYEIPRQTELAERLAKISGMDNVFFANSGAEANEAAIKLARLHGSKQGIKRPTIVVTDESFHGRTMATLTATGNRKVHAGFEPLLNGFVRAPFNDISAIQHIAENNPEVVAVFVEPVQGEAGITIPDAGYLEELRGIADQHNWLLMLDEVQSGNGRTGKFFAYQHTNILPDVVTTAKGLGNGVPIGVCLARGPAAELFQPGHHGSTFGGNPLACAAAHAVLDTLERDNLIERAAELGDRILKGLNTALHGNNRIKEIRGKGLMIAVELADPCTELVAKGLEAGILLNVTQETIVRLLPPLTLSDAEADEIVAKVAGLINA
ncbi:MAG: aspartate aminotransferase family protein [Gammaproteobacteria bacterium]|nr:aspartate aminotransferase family protein [Gammaproteobacteria bacterium]